MSHTCLIATRAGLVRNRLSYLLLGTVLFFGCASRGTRKTASLSHAKNVEASAEEIGARNQSLLAIYSSEIENAADRIIRESPSPQAHREALVWKTEAIPVLQASLLNTDPLVAVVDTWAFIVQMQEYMQRPATASRLGDFQGVPVDTTRHMEAEMEKLVITAAPSADIDHLRGRIEAWAAAHPMQGGLSGRTSLDADLIRRTYKQDLGALATLKALQENLGDITARLDSYNAYLPKQARWQAELLVTDFSRNPKLTAAASDFTVLSHAMSTASNNLDQMPKMAARAREVALSDVDHQRVAAQDFLAQQREKAFDDLAQQRIAAIADLRGERLAATADLRGEREIVLNTLHQEEVRMMSDLHTLSQDTLNDLDRKSRRLVDHIFWRAFELVIAAVLLSFLAAWILLRRFSPRRELPERNQYRSAA
jgi:hypothetical protein